MTKEDWAKIEQTLSGHYGRVTIKIGDRVILLVRQLVAKNRLGIVVRVDGKISWGSPNEQDTEYQFHRQVVRYIWSAKSRVAASKISKKGLERLKWNPDEKGIYYVPYWTSFTALRRHYQKTFASIELLEGGA